jgi:glycogen debranching enzyme
VVSDRRGDVRSDRRVPPHGFFAEDTRYLSRWQLDVQGHATDVLSCAQTDYYVAQFFLVVPSPTFHSAPTLAVVRNRLVSDLWTEELVVVNHRDEHVPVTVDVGVGTDFADLFEVKDGVVAGREIEIDRDDRLLVLRYRNGGLLRETRVSVDAEADIADDGLRLNTWLAPREERRISFTITPHSERHDRTYMARRQNGSFEEQRDAHASELAEWASWAPTLETECETLRHVYRGSLSDLAALRFYPHAESQEESLPAAGLPWFMTLFGRDSLITSIQTLPFFPSLAATTLRALAERQGAVLDDFRDEEPGKILHELRFGELTVTGRTPHSPYYGAADSTPLFLVLLDEYERWTGDSELVRTLERNARSALDWVDSYGDLDDDGYVEYATRNPDTGLVNQCWKDSWNSILFADGAVAEGPIATCEIQGYVYDAKRRCARLARDVWHDETLAARLELEAQRLRERFLEDFWMPAKGCFALALDGHKRQVDSITSNVGHLLWSGIADETRAQAIARHLMGNALYSGWGVRTMASDQGGYNPVEYHNGTVWPHDNSLIAAGLRRYGFDGEAAEIADAVVRAAGYFDHRLPEVFAGSDKRLTSAPVEYPTACRPQAWASAAPLLLLSTTLGLSPHDGGLRSRPHLPTSFGHIALRGVPGSWGRADVEA